MITVNGVDLRDLGFVASGRPQLPRLGGERTHVQTIPGRYGGVRMGGQVGDDTLSVTGHISAPDHATLLQRLDLLAGVLQGRSVIRLSDYPDREWVGYLQQGPSRASAIGPAWITRAENIVLQWTIPDPTARGQVEISQVPGALALGTAPSPLRVEVQNGGVAPISRVVVEALPNEIRNADLEDSVPGYAPHWDPSPSRNLLWPTAAMEHVITSGTVIELLGGGVGTPLSVLALAPGRDVSGGVEIECDPGTTAEWGVIWYDGVGVEVTRRTAQSADTAWTRSERGALAIPAGAVSMRYYLRRASGTGAARFRLASLNAGSTVLAYAAPSHVVYDPARAYSGSRYALLTQVAGSTRSAYQRVGAAGGAIRRWPVRPGDRIEFGGRVYREAGDGYGVIVVTPYDAADVAGTLQPSTRVEVAAWTPSHGTYTVPASGVASIGIRCYLRAETATTRARFDDVYLRILRQGESQRILEWNGSVAPGDLWECDAELFRVLNGGANAIDGLTAASEFPVAEPGEGGYGYVLVTITGGGGHTSTVRYRRRWL